MTRIISGNVTATTVLFAVVGVALTAKSYLEQVFVAVNKYPKAVTGSFVFGAFYFCYNLVVLSVTWNQVSYLQALYRGAFLFGAITMLFGPFLVLTPTHPIVLKKETLLKKIVRGAQKEETRYITFACFCFLTLCQGFVVYALYDVLERLLNLDITMVLIICIFYGLISIFYLCVFWSVMMKQELVLMGINLLDVIRKKLIFEYREQEYDILAMKHFATLYVTAFICLLVAALALIVTMFVYDCLRIDGMDDATVWVIVLCFILHIVTLIVFSIFILNVAFHPINVSKSVDIDGVVIDVDMIKWTGVCRLEDHAPLLDIAAVNQPHNHLGAIRAALKHHLSSSNMTTEHMAAAVIEVDETAKLHQMNDMMLAFFVATGLEYPVEVAQHYLWFLSREVIPLVSSNEVAQCFGAFGLNYLLAEAVASLNSQYSDKKAMNDLIKEAKKHVIALETIVCADKEHMAIDTNTLFPPSNTLPVLAQLCSRLAEVIPISPVTEQLVLDDFVMAKGEVEESISSGRSSSSNVSSDYSDGCTEENDEEEMEINELPKGGKGYGGRAKKGGKVSNNDTSMVTSSPKKEEVPRQQMPIKRKSFVQEQVERIEGKQKNYQQQPRARLGGRHGDSSQQQQQQLMEQDAALEEISKSVMQLKEISAEISSELEHQSMLLDDVDLNMDNAAPSLNTIAPPSSKWKSEGMMREEQKPEKKKKIKLADKNQKDSVPPRAAKPSSSLPYPDSAGPPTPLLPAPPIPPKTPSALPPPASAPLPRTRNTSSIPPAPSLPSSSASLPVPPSRSIYVGESKSATPQMEYELLEEIRNNDLMSRAVPTEEEEIDELEAELFGSVAAKDEVPRSAIVPPRQPSQPMIVHQVATVPLASNPSNFVVSPHNGFCDERSSNVYRVDAYPDMEGCILYGHSAVERNPARPYRFQVKATNLQNHSLYIGWVVSHADNYQFLAMGRWQDLLFKSEHKIGLLTHDLSACHQNSYLSFAGGTVLGRNAATDKYYIGPMEQDNNTEVSVAIRYVDTSTGMQCLVSFAIANRDVFTASLPAAFAYIPVVCVIRNMNRLPHTGMIAISTSASTRKPLSISLPRRILVSKHVTGNDDMITELQRVYDQLRTDVLSSAMMDQLIRQSLILAIQCVRAVTPLSNTQVQLLESYVSIVIATSYRQWIDTGGPLSFVFSVGAGRGCDKVFEQEVERLFRISITGGAHDVCLQQVLTAHMLRWVLLSEPAAVLPYINAYWRIFRICKSASPAATSWQILEREICGRLYSILQKVIYSHWNMETPDVATFEIDSSPV